MSIVSSYISSRAPVFKINVQASMFMDHILAIVAGLGVRVVIDVVDYEDHRLTGSLVGLWEGVVVQHFVKKSPKSFDPYVAYGVRVFIDFLFTESLIRLVLTFLFTGMGIVFADIAPRVWAESGLRRFWRHLRRDLYTLVHSVPSVPYFARPRTVRFSPSRAPSVIISVPPSPSVVTIATQAPIVPVPRKRPVPGSFPDYVSEADTDPSIRSPGSDYSTLTGRTRDRRPTVQTESETSYDPDEGNRSSSVSGTSTPILGEADLPNLPNIEDEDVAREVVLEDHKDENTPRPPPLKLPPTPSDTTYAIHINADEPHEVPPPSAGLPQIPDDEDWENISRREAQATPLPRSEDGSTSSDPQLSTSADQQAPASGTPPAAETQPADVPLGGTRKPEVVDLDPYAEQPPHTPADEALTTTTTKPPPVINNEGDFDLLPDLNTSTSNPVAQTSDSRPPSYAQLAFDGSGLFSDSIWGPKPIAASSGGNTNIWGMKDKQRGAEAGSNKFVAGAGTTDPVQESQEQDDTQHIEPTAAGSGEERDSNTTPEVVSTPAPTTEAPMTEAPASQPDNARSGPSPIQQDRNPMSFTPQSETTTSQPQDGTDPASNAPTRAEYPNTQQDVGPAGEEAATEEPCPAQETNENKDNKPNTAGENTEAITLTHPTIDEESFPEKNSDRLDKALELRLEIARIEKSIIKLARNVPAHSKEEEEKLKSLKAKAERWYSLVSESENPSTKVDLSEAPAPVFMGSAQTAIISCLLKNIRKVVIIVGPIDDKHGKARKGALTARLDKLNLTSRAYHVGNQEITVFLPTSM